MNIYGLVHGPYLGPPLASLILAGLAIMKVGL